MKKMKSNVESFATAKLQAIRLCLITAVIALAFTVTACSSSGDDGNDDDNGDKGDNGSGKWRVNSYRYYKVIDGVASNNPDYYYYYIYIRYTDDKNCEYEYVDTTGSYTSTETSSYDNKIIYNYHVTRDGQNYIQNLNSESFATTRIHNSNTVNKNSVYSETTSTYSSVYDLETGLTKNAASTSATENITPSATTNSSGSSEQSYYIDLIGEANGVKTYKHYVTGYTYNGASQDASAMGYTEYKFQNGRILEAKQFTGTGLLQSITTYTLTNNQEIISRIGDYSVSSTIYPSNPENNSNSTVEVVSSSDTGLTIRTKTFVNGKLSSQYDTFYEKKTGASARPFDDNKEYVYTVSNGTVTIDGYRGKVGTETKGNVTIPSQLEGKPVTSIGSRSLGFFECYRLTGVTIPEGVTSIESEAFSRCIRLTDVTIPSSLTTIGGFRDCWNLTGITIPNGVTTIGDYAFEYCTRLTSVTIPDSVTSIGQYAFYNCTGLTSITIPASVTSIGSYAFFNCTSLTSVTFNGTIKRDGNDYTLHFYGNAFGYEGTNDGYLGDLYNKFYATDWENGTPGTYTRAANSLTWTKQN